MGQIIDATPSGRRRMMTQGAGQNISLEFTSMGQVVVVDADAADLFITPLNIARKQLNIRDSNLFVFVQGRLFPLGGSETVYEVVSSARSTSFGIGSNGEVGA